MASWEEHKDLGNAAFKAQDFPRAVEHFTEAISLNASAHVLYSNRSAAHASLRAWTKALADANECVALAPSFAKGYGRRGAALEGMGDLQGAVQAYEAGLTQDPANESLKTALAAARQRMAAGAAGMGLGGPPPGAGMAVGTLAVVLNLAIVLGFLFYVLPFLGARVAFTAYRLSLMAVAAKHGAAALRGRSFPRGWSAAAATFRALRSDDNAHYAGLSFFLILWNPVPIAVTPAAAFAVAWLAPLLRSTADKLPGRARALVAPRLDFLAGPEGQMACCAFAATAEVMVTVTLVLSLLGGIRNFAILLVYLNFLSLRYKSSHWTRQVVHLLRAKAEGVAKHPRAPAAVGAVFDRVVRAIAGYFADPPPPQRAQ